MNGEKRFKILKFLQEGGESFFDLLLVMATAPYGSSLKHLENLLEKQYIQRKRNAKEVQERRRFQNLISQLKQEGLIIITKRDAGSKVSLTPRGETTLKRLAVEQSLHLPTHYTVSPEKQNILVIFDIPEVRARERVWLRRTLLHLGFSMLQKSVWLGDHKLPEELIDDLRTQKLLDHVEILAITKTGSIRHLTK